MPKRNPEDQDEWCQHKEDILRIYMTEDKPLAELMHIMTSRGFTKTKSQYERSFKQWGVSKNVREEEWKFIFCRLKERQRLHKESAVHVRGILISDAKLKKQRTKLRQTTFEQCLEQTRQSSRMKTPPTIKVFTPPSSPTVASEHTNSIAKIMNQDDTAGNERQPPSLPASFGLVQAARQDKITDKYGAATETSSRPEVTKTLVPTSSDQPLHTHYMRLSEDTISLHSSSDTTKSVGSAKNPDGVSPLKLFDTTSSSSIFQQQSPVDGAVCRAPNDPASTTQSDLLLRDILLKHAHTDNAAMLLIKKAQGGASLHALRSLLELPETSSVALHTFMQRLLNPAVVDGNISLVQVLLEAGVNPDTRAHLETMTAKSLRAVSPSHQETQRSQMQPTVPHMTALHTAVYNRREDMVVLLLQHGATDWRADFQGANGYITGSILDVIIEMGKHQEWTISDHEDIRPISRSMLKTILHFGTSVASQSQGMLLRALRHAVLNNRLDLILLLLDYHPDILETAKKTPWIMLEAASTLPELDLFWFFVHKGFIPNARNSSGLGSAVAAFASNQDAPKLIFELNEANMDINGKAFGLGPPEERSHGMTIAERILESAHGMTALHIAVRDGNESLLRLLLYLGADVNRCCCVYPIQLAAWNGSEPIVKMLIEAGADVNATYNKEQCYSFHQSDPHNQNLSANTTAARIASERGHSRIVEMLCGAEEKTPTSAAAMTHWSEMPILGDAIVAANSTLVCQLLSDKTLPGGKLHPQHAIRGLILAVKNPKVGLISALLHAGANPYGKLDPSFGGLEVFDDSHMLDPWESPFEGAVLANALDTIETFLIYCDDIADEEELLNSKRQISAAYASAVCTGNLQLKALILRNGLDPKGIDSIMGPNYVPQRLHFELQHATESRNFTDAERLLDIGAPPNSPNDNTANTSGMMTPLQYAAKYNNISIFKRLIQAGAAIDTPPQIVEGWTALQLAASNGNADMVDLLVISGADINARPAAFNGRTAMEAAVEHGHKTIASYLLVHGADFQGRHNTHYRRALYRAWKNEHHAMVDALHSWMMEKDGRDGTEPVKDVVESVTQEELDFIDEEAKMEYEAYLHEYDSASDDGEDEGVAATIVTEGFRAPSLEYTYSANDWLYASVELQ